MKSPSLLGRILRLHVAVVASACVLLVVGTMAIAAFLLRRDQNESLRSLAHAVCRGVPREVQMQGTDYVTAARVFLDESAIEGIRVEILDREDRLLVSHGRLTAWREAGYRIAPPDQCSSQSLEMPGRKTRVYRLCSDVCDASHKVQVIMRDVLDRHDVRRATVALLVLLPLAIVIGALTGRYGIARLLRPLQALRDAATRAEAAPGISLSVKTELEELITLERAFDNLLERLGEMIAREKRFTQEASHELRTPLTLLKSRLEHLANGLGSRADLLAVAQRAQADIASLDRLIDALLILARSESVEFRSIPVNLCDLARDVAGRQALADGNGSPRPEVSAPDEILVSGSEELLTRALANVVENARKYGGRHARIVIRVFPNGAYGSIVVEDSGDGISPDLRPYVFDRFSRGPSIRDSVPGTGLGLAVVRAIVVRHGGRVQTGRAALGGESVHLSLPLLEQAD